MTWFLIFAAYYVVVVLMALDQRETITETCDRLRIPPPSRC